MLIRKSHSERNAAKRRISAENKTNKLFAFAQGDNPQGFTLVELMVAVGMMAIIIAFTSVIFRFGIDAYRVSTASAEIMQKARAITGQLNSDFEGLQKNMPLMIFFMQDDTNDAPNCYDQIMFFATGEFSSYQLYDDGVTDCTPLDFNDPADAKVVKGNLARIFYSLAQSYDRNMTDFLEPLDIDSRQRILARRANILSADETLEQWPDAENITNSFIEQAAGKDYYKNDFYEHDSLTLADWKNTTLNDNDVIIDTCFDYNTREIVVDKRKVDTFHKLLSENVSSFAIQWAYWDNDGAGDDELRWFPSDDPDGNEDYSDSHLVRNGVLPYGKFGVHFNLDEGTNLVDWFYVGELEYRGTNQFPAEFYPEALKFTFTLRDSKNIIEGGRTFTHIVYLDD